MEGVRLELTASGGHRRTRAARIKRAGDPGAAELTGLEESWGWRPEGSGPGWLLDSGLGPELGYIESQGLRRQEAQVASGQSWGGFKAVDMGPTCLFSRQAQSRAQKLVVPEKDSQAEARCGGRSRGSLFWNKPGMIWLVTGNDDQSCLILGDLPCPWYSSVISSSPEGLAAISVSLDSA